MWRKINLNIWEKFESAPKMKGRGGVEAEVRPPRGFLGGPGPPGLVSKLGGGGLMPPSKGLAPR